MIFLTNLFPWPLFCTCPKGQGRSGDSHWIWRVPRRRQKVPGLLLSLSPAAQQGQRGVNSSDLGINGKTKIWQEGSTWKSLLSKSVKSLKDGCGEAQGCYTPLLSVSCMLQGHPAKGMVRRGRAERGPHWAWNSAMFCSLNHEPGTRPHLPERWSSHSYTECRRGCFLLICLKPRLCQLWPWSENVLKFWNAKTQGHPLKFYESSLKINKRWHYFIQWVVNIWNSLSSRCCEVHKYK